MGDLTIGICTSHQNTRTNEPGIVLTGANNIFADGLSVAGFGSLTLSNCGHLGIIVTGANNVFINGKPAATQGSYFVSQTGYTGYVIGCSGKVFYGG